MDFIELVGSAEPWIGAVAFFSIFGGIVLFMAILWDGWRTALFGIIVLVFGVGLMMYGSSLNSSSRIDRNEKALQSIEDSYGLKLTDEQFEALEYPSERPPGDSERFGSYTDLVRVDGGFEAREIYLIWDRGEMSLAESSNGDQLTQLKTAR